MQEQPAKFIVHGGWVRSVRDGQLHYISARKCCEAYGILYYDKRVFALVEHRNPNDTEHTLRGIRQGHYVHLYPRPDGDYAEHFRDLTEPQL